MQRFCTISREILHAHTETHSSRILVFRTMYGIQESCKRSHTCINVVLESILSREYAIDGFLRRYVTVVSVMTRTVL